MRLSDSKMVALEMRPWRSRVMYWSRRSSLPPLRGLDHHSSVP